MTPQLVVDGLSWTTKSGFVYPNEFIYWSIQIVLYPYMTGLVAGAFVLSSLYHVFGQKDLRTIARFSLVFSLALLPVAMMPLLFHLQQPLRGIEVMFTPHFTSAISAFGIVFSTYAVIVLTEIWFVYRQFFVEQTIALKGKPGFSNGVMRIIYNILTLGAYNLEPGAIAVDKKTVKIMAAIGIPVACFLHGYAGFIFGSVKANALWMSPLMPVIFIVSAVVSGIALCMLTYIIIMEWKKFRATLARGRGDETIKKLGGVEMDVMIKTKRYLLAFLIAAISLEFLDMIFRGYTAMKSWDILRAIMFQEDFIKIFVMQYFFGNFIPLVMLLLPRPTIKRLIVSLSLILFGVFMMRWNVVIGGQAFSLSFNGFMHYHMPFWPTSLETYKEGFFGAITVGITPFVLFWLLNKVVPAIDDQH
ncbi:MAG TPA: oxidoreductase [Desulfobacterales bacterium]|nr:oxidoreductase [Desulfobacterales bacterium]